MEDSSALVGDQAFKTDPAYPTNTILGEVTSNLSWLSPS